MDRAEQERLIAESVASLNNHVGYAVIKEKCRQYLATSMNQIRNFNESDNSTYVVLQAQTWLVVNDILENLPKEILNEDILVDE